MYPKSHQEIALESIRCFRDDGTLDLAELDHLMDIALRDKVVNDDERRVLGNIFKQVTRAEVSDEVWERIQAIKDKHEIP